MGRDEAGRAPVRSFRGGYRRRTHRTAKADGGDGCVRGAPAARPRTPCVTRELPRVRLAMRSGSDEDDGPGRGPRLAPVREPEPINDFERARLENIRRNQEALAGECQCLNRERVCGTRADVCLDAALMGGVEAIAPKISEAVAPAPRRRGRTAQVREAHGALRLE